MRQQVERILSLDVDGSGFPTVGERDPVAGELQRRYPGCDRWGSGRRTRPRPGPSSGTASASPRPRRSRPGWPRARRAGQLRRPGGARLPVPAAAGQARHVPRAGRAQAGMASVAGAGRAGRPARRRPAAGHAARGRDGRPEEAARHRGLLRRADLLRGAGDPDAVPSQEPRLARAVALAYGLPGPATPEQVVEISEDWRPYRTWVTLLLRIQLEYQTGEISGRQGHARTG